MFLSSFVLHVFSTTELEDVCTVQLMTLQGTILSISYTFFFPFGLIIGRTEQVLETDDKYFVN